MRDKMATNYVKATYTEIIDLQTIRGQTSIVGIHTPTGSGPYSKLLGYFHNFRKYHYKGISKLIMIPAANLPVDPLGLTGVQGTTDLMDPRDALNPIQFHGVHGEHLTSVVDQFYGHHGVAFDANGRANPSVGFVSDTADKIDNGNPASSVSYYRALTDPTWKKFGIQSGVTLRRLHPLTWRVVRSSPLVPNLINPSQGMIRTGDGINSDTGVTGGNVPMWSNLEISNVPNTVAGEANVRQFIQEFTNGVAPLGWLPTSNMAQNGEVTVNILPKLFMGILVLPPAYNVEQFFRLSIRHVFEFRDFTASTGLLGTGSISLPGINISNNITGYYNWIDYTDPEGKKIAEISDYTEGTTLDCIGAASEVISDGVN